MKLDACQSVLARNDMMQYINVEAFVLRKLTESDQIWCRTAGFVLPQTAGYKMLD